jgi:P2 family phage contractile tail tube protein
MANIPKIIRNFNVFVDGTNCAGKVDEVKLPSLKIKVEEHRAGGLDAPVPIDMGMEMIEFGFTAAEHLSEVLGKFGLSNGRAAHLVFRAAQVADGKVTPYVIEARGLYKEVNLNSVKIGDKAPFEATMACRFFQVTLNGKALIKIDVDNMIREIDGQDQLADIRNAIS